MDRTRNRQEQRPVQLDLFRNVGRRRPANSNDPFAASGTNPTRGVFNGHDVRKQPAKFRGSLTLADLGAYVGPANEYPEGYRR